MKKKLKLFSILCIFLFIFTLVSCKNNEKPPEEEPKEEEKTEEIHDEITGTHALTDELKNILTDLLNESFEEPPVCTYYNEPLFYEYIDMLCEGRQAVYVKFDSDNYYHACAYREKIPEEGEKATYTWIGFSHESEIKEYNGKERIIAAYQINPSLPAENVLEESELKPVVEKIRRHGTKFENGENVIRRMPLDKTYVHIAPPNKEVIYCSATDHYHLSYEIPHAEIDGELYFTVEAPDEDKLKNWQFWKYYDELSKIMITGKYSIQSAGGSRKYYVVFKPEDIKEFIQTIKEAGE